MLITHFIVVMITCRLHSRDDSRSSNIPILTRRTSLGSSYLHTTFSNQEHRKVLVKGIYQYSPSEDPWGLIYSYVPKPVDPFKGFINGISQPTVIIIYKLTAEPKRLGVPIDLNRPQSTWRLHADPKRSTRSIEISARQVRHSHNNF